MIVSSRGDIAASRAEDEALEWLVDFENLSGDEERRFFAWLDEQPEHRAAFEKVERDWRRLDVVRRLATGEPDPDVAGKWLRRRRRRLYLPLAAAAAVAVLAVVLVPLSTPDFEAGYRTGIGEHREIHLPDDSVVALNTDSELTVRYSRDERRVVLLRGEAHFDVAHAPQRPFNVLAGAGSVRAVGTAFNVYLKGDIVEVTVTKGIVEVRPSAAPPGNAAAPKGAPPAALPPPKTVTEGEQLEYGETIESVSHFDPQKVARRLAWQDGMLDFQGETLAEVIEEASRYTSTRITIDDPEIEGLHVTGYFRAGDVDTLLKLIESNERVAVQRIHPGLVRLTARRD